MARPSILVARGLNAAQKTRLDAFADVIDITATPDEDEVFRAELRKVDGVLCSALRKIESEWLREASPRLKVVSNFGVGFDNVDIPTATELGIRVCNTPGVLDYAVAEITMALMLGITRRVAEASEFAKDGQWGRRPFPLGTDLNGKILGILGFGRVGKEVAKRAMSFGMTVIYTDVVDAGPGEWQRVSQSELLQTADIVTLHLNLSDQTRGMIGKEAFNSMKPTSFLVNTARGPIVDHEALYDALAEGQISGAAVDVLDPEPPQPDDPILKLPNILITPHIGTATTETRAAMGDLWIANIIDVLSGKTPAASVNSPLEA